MTQQAENQVFNEINLESIIAYANKNNLPFEAYTPIKDRFNENNYNGTLVGLELKRDVWYWWIIDTRKLNLETYHYEYTNDPYISFSERYNRVNGARQTSWRKGYEAKNMILNNLNNLNY